MAAQLAGDETAVDAGGLTLSDMGTMTGGGGPARGGPSEAGPGKKNK